MTADHGSQPRTAPTSSLALASLLTGVLGLTFLPLLGGLIAVVTGRMARQEIAESQGEVGGRELATAGYWMGWVSIGLFVVGVCCFGTLIVVPLCLAALIAPEFADGLTAYYSLALFA